MVPNASEVREGIWKSYRGQKDRKKQNKSGRQESEVMLSDFFSY